MPSLTQLRAEARSARRAHLDPAGAAQVVAESVMASGWLDGVTRVGATLADDGELDPGPVVEICRSRGATIYLPVLCDPDPMRFAPAAGDCQFIPNRYGIPEPDVSPEMLVSAEELDMVLAPLVIFDDAGHRAGRGGGYYDRALTFLLNRNRPSHPLVIGLAYESQWVDAVPTHPGDVAVDAVVTEQRVRVFGSGSPFR